VPWAHSAMLKLNHLHGYEEAAVVGARAGASQMGIITENVANDPNYTGAPSDQAVLPTEVNPGAVMRLPAGLDFKKFDPNQPSTNFADFVKAMLRGVASGMGVSYNGLANDLEGVSYSSIRYGSLEEREVWKELQKHLIEHVLEDIYEAWLVRAVVNGALSLPASKVGNAVTAHRWRARGWAWVDPLKDMQANELALGMGVTTLTRIAAENGEDFEEIIYERAGEVELIKSLHLELNDGTKPTTTTNGANPNEANKPKSGKPQD
jgi:lambda family phage portal protein